MGMPAVLKPNTSMTGFCGEKLAIGDLIRQYQETGVVIKIIDSRVMIEWDDGYYSLEYPQNLSKVK